MTFIKIPYSESAYSITPYSQWKQVNAIILRFVNKISKWFALICFQRLYGVIEYADSEYGILMKVIRIYLLFTCQEK